jgi:hypothetical protein
LRIFAPATNLTAITPIDDRVTEINHCVYWTLPWLGMLKPALRHYVRAFLRQDRDIMGRQQQGLRFSPPLTLIDDADTRGKLVLRAEARIPPGLSRGPPVREPSPAAYPRVEKLRVRSKSGARRRRADFGCIGFLYTRLRRRRIKPNQRRAEASKARLAGSGTGSALAVGMTPSDARFTS